MKNNINKNCLLRKCKNCRYEQNCFKYFKNKSKAYAYKIEEIKEVDIEPSELIQGFKPPQSFVYIN